MVAGECRSVVFRARARLHRPAVDPEHDREVVGASSGLSGSTSGLENVEEEAALFAVAHTRVCSDQVVGRVRAVCGLASTHTRSELELSPGSLSRGDRHCHLHTRGV